MRMILISFCGVILFTAGVKAKIYTWNDCNNMCVGTFDTEKQEIRVEKKSNVKSDEELIMNYNYGGWGPDFSFLNNTIKTFIIGEGINGMEAYKLQASYQSQLGRDENSVIKLPSTFSIPYPRDTFYTSTLFKTIDLSDVNNKYLYLNGAGAATTIIMDGKAGNQVILNKDMIIKCKGALDSCDEQISTPSWGNKSDLNLTYQYYTGLDKDGNWEVWSDEGKAIYADSSMQKPLSKYDFDGNQTGLYEYDRGGNLVKAIENGVEIYRRRIYTISEATAAVSGKNTFKIQYR